MGHFTFKAVTHGDQQWFPIGRDGNGGEVWCDGCITNDQHLAERIAANMDAAYRAGLQVAARSMTQHLIEMLGNRGSLSNTHSGAGWVVCRDGRVLADSDAEVKATIESVCSPEEQFAVVLEYSHDFGITSTQRPYKVPSGMNEMVRDYLSDTGSMVLIANRSVLLANGLDLRAEDFDNPIEIDMDVLRMHRPCPF